ncbi:unnamed protein product [Effrenium voratum]|uniref:Uncharacterized protein n=1 Tax=Effrenium voratum TaxID=2562239 RepID=A0AA36N056_9DINO|nr:unnamed protein product [Effrenium voratum]
MARAHELSTSVAGENYPVRPVDRWYLKTRADLQLDGNSYGGHFLDTTTDREKARQVLQRVQFTTAVNRGLMTQDAELEDPPRPEKRVRLPAADMRATFTEKLSAPSAPSPARRLPQLELRRSEPRLPAPGPPPPQPPQPLPGGMDERRKKLKSVSADTRFSKRGLGRGGPRFWPEHSFSQSMMNLRWG